MSLPQLVVTCRRIVKGFFLSQPGQRIRELWEIKSGSFRIIFVFIFYISVFTVNTVKRQPVV